MNEQASNLFVARTLSVRMFSSEYPPCWGGVGKHVQNLCRRLVGQVDLHLVTVTYGHPTEQFEITNLAGLHVKSFPLLLAQYLARVSFHDNRNDITHIHVPHAFVPKRQCKIVSTFHVVWADYSAAMEGQHAFSLFDRQFPTLNRQLLRTERRLARMSDAIIAVSHNVKDKLVENYDIDADKIHVIHNGVNSGDYCPSGKRDSTILYVGRQTSHKGLPYLLRGFAKFLRNHSDYWLVIVGERLEGGVDPALVRYARELGISGKVEFTGRLTDSEVGNILGRARCLVLPSLAESFGMAVLEAMASETPVVATRVGGIPEVVRDGHNGLLVQPASSEELAEALERIVSDDELRINLVREGKKTAQEFSWNKTAEETLSVYEQISS